jgi:hypothetical protein
MAASLLLYHIKDFGDLATCIHTTCNLAGVITVAFTSVASTDREAEYSPILSRPDVVDTGSVRGMDMSDRYEAVAADIVMRKYQ